MTHNVTCQHGTVEPLPAPARPLGVAVAAGERSHFSCTDNLEALEAASAEVVALDPVSYLSSPRQSTAWLSAASPRSTTRSPPTSPSSPCRAARPDGERVYVILDNLSAHKSKKIWA